ncbi:MAG: hypothetical protein K1X91_11010 [Bacteriodetes bacterium]|nr:hypothetical protein [Bacteroidota bacterium]
MKYLSGLLLSITLTVGMYAQTVDEVLSKYYQAVGGAENFRNIQTYIIKAKSVNSSGTWKRPYSMYGKGNKVYTIMNAQAGIDAKQGFNGTSGWRVQPWSGSLDPFPMNADDSKELQLSGEQLVNDLFTYKTRNTTLEMQGKDEIDGSDCYKIMATRTDGVVVVYYLDVDSYLLVKRTVKRKESGVDTESDSYFSNYRKVNGMLLPFSIEGSWGGGLAIESYQINTPIEDSTFEMPEKK